MEMKKDYVGAAMSEGRRRPVASASERDGECGSEREDGRHCYTGRGRGSTVPQGQWCQGNATGHQRGWQMVV